MLLQRSSADFHKPTAKAWSTCPCTISRSVTVILDSMLSTRVCAQQLGAKDAATGPPHDLKEVEIHLVQRVGALATDCSARLNQPRRARNHLDDGRVRRTRAGLKTPKPHVGCGERPRSSSSRRHRFLPRWSVGFKIYCFLIAVSYTHLTLPTIYSV